MPCLLGDVDLVVVQGIHVSAQAMQAPGTACQPCSAGAGVQRRRRGEHGIRYDPYSRSSTCSGHAQQMIHRELACTSSTDAVLWHLVSKLPRGQVNYTAGRLCEKALATAQASMDMVHECCAGANPLPLAEQQKAIQTAQEALTKTVKTVSFARRLVRLSSINAELQNMQKLQQQVHSAVALMQLGRQTMTNRPHTLVQTLPQQPSQDQPECSEVASSAGQECDDTADTMCSG